MTKKINDIIIDKAEVSFWYHQFVEIPFMGFDDCGWKQYENVKPIIIDYSTLRDTQKYCNMTFWDLYGIFCEDIIQKKEYIGWSLEEKDIKEIKRLINIASDKYASDMKKFSKLLEAFDECLGISQNIEYSVRGYVDNAIKLRQIN